MPILGELLEICYVLYLALVCRRAVRKLKYNEPHVRAVRHHGPAYRALQDGDAAGAARRLTATLLQCGSPSPDVAYWLRAQAWLHLGEHAKALTDANRALGHNLELAGAYRVKAEVYLHQHRPEAALDELVYADRLSDAAAEHHRLRARALQLMGQPEAAAAENLRAHVLAQQNT